MQDINFKLINLQGNFVMNLFNIFSIFLISFASSLLGYSAYLFLEAFALTEIKYSSWSGEALMWALIFFFTSLFILFIPIELKLIKEDESSDFQNVLGRIVITVILSVLLLFVSSVFFTGKNIILQNIYLIMRAYAFSGLVFVNIASFLLWWISDQVTVFKTYSLTITGIIWVLGSLLFIN